jgi:hypothetical protein
MMSIASSYCNGVTWIFEVDQRLLVIKLGFHLPHLDVCNEQKRCKKCQKERKNRVKRLMCDLGLDLRLVVSNNSYLPGWILSPVESCAH